MRGVVALMNVDDVSQNAEGRGYNYLRDSSCWVLLVEEERQYWRIDRNRGWLDKGKAQAR